MQHLQRLLILFALAGSLSAAGQDRDEAEHTGPLKDVTYQVLWLIESDDVHRAPYTGPAREGLTASGYGRLVPAGSAAAPVSVGQGSTVTGASRYGQLSVLLSMLNTTDADELQINIELHTKNESPLHVHTTTRVPLGRWFLVGAAQSRVGLPKHADDSKRGVVIMKIDQGALLLD